MIQIGDVVRMHHFEARVKRENERELQATFSHGRGSKTRYLFLLLGVEREGEDVDVIEALKMLGFERTEAKGKTCGHPCHGLQLRCCVCTDQGELCVTCSEDIRNR